MSGVGHELAIERVIDAPIDTVWDAMTNHLTEWWCPRPWTSEIVALDWHSGGRFAITMRGPEGEVHPIEGVLLEAVPRERIVFTNALDVHWNPRVAQPVNIVGMFELSDAGDGKTRYRAIARHWSAADRDAHDKMGFSEGWGICADQLAEVAQKLKDPAHA